MDKEPTSRTGHGAMVVVEPRVHELGGVRVHRVLPSRLCRSVGPFIFLDHMGPTQFGPGTGLDIGPHPHINMAAITYLFEGHIVHRDSLGTEQVIGPGDINLMVCGSGILHSERQDAQQRTQQRTLCGLQLWMALPEEHEETPPSFTHYPGASIPKRIIQDVAVRVLMGSAYGATSPVSTFAPTLYIEATLRQSQTLDLPDADETAVYVVRGQVGIGERRLDQHHLAVATPGDRITATKDARIAIIGGQKIGHRFMDWNFVSSRRERIQEAKEMYQRGGFTAIPGDDAPNIPLPG